MSPSWRCAMCAAEGCVRVFAGRSRSAGTGSSARYSRGAGDWPATASSIRHQSGRLQLAYWLSGKENPLTARVMANRVWMHLFGRGLVESVDNFGCWAMSLSHPELLDHLAVRFVENGLVDQDADSRDRLIAHLSVGDGPSRGELRNRCRQSVPVADESPPTGSRSDSRRHAADQRPARSSSRPKASPVMKMAAADLGRRRRRGHAARGNS